jgi:chorismate--pyruvate lyase
LWLENRAGLRHKMPEKIQSWAYESGSITQRLRAIYGNTIQVKILRQHWRHPFLTERRLLRIPEHHYCLTREVLLHTKGKPLILARTIIPAGTIKVARSNLSHLGTRPLGEVIFSCPKLERMAMNVTVVSPRIMTQLAIDAGNISQPLWGRRTVYAIRHQHLLVSEFFLTAIF